MGDSLRPISEPPAGEPLVIPQQPQFETGGILFDELGVDPLPVPGHSPERHDDLRRGRRRIDETDRHGGIVRARGDSAGHFRACRSRSLSNSYLDIGSVTADRLDASFRQRFRPEANDLLVGAWRVSWFVVRTMSESLIIGGPTLVDRTDVTARQNVGSSALVRLFAATLFMSAFLMFLVEPMIARILLPSLGGAPAVWNTCLVFFQAMLLVGYGYAHGATQYLGVRRHIILHCVLLLVPLIVLPIAVRHSPPQGLESPALWVLLTLLGSIGLPFFVLSTTAAVMQKWFSSTNDGAAADPYFLYAASNLGSFIALMAYPLVVEPNLRLQDQATMWTAGYVVLIALSFACAAVVWRSVAPMSAATRAEPGRAEALSWGRRGRWVALAAVPSSLLLAVTNYISTDVASMPLLWVLPLALYLLTLVIAFNVSAGRVRAMASRLMPLSVTALTLVLMSALAGPLWLVIPIHLVAFSVIATACHGQLADDRPSAQRLTEFFFWTAFGGMVGGLFNALVAPVIFHTILEYPLVLVAATLLRATPASRAGRLSRADVAIPLAVGVAVAIAALVNNQFGSLSRYIILGAAVPALFTLRQKEHPRRFAASIAMILLAGALTDVGFGQVVYAKRTFFGVNRVRVDAAHGYRSIFHGTTLHGMQSLDPSRSGEPVSYYHRAGPIGQVFQRVPLAPTAPQVAVLGLGVGTLASYRAPAQRWTFYEIDPAVENIARNDAYFTYLRTCGDACTVMIGDGRVSLTRAEPQTYGLIVLDAFSSDAVPMHLITKESLALYLSKLAPGGVIAFNISNVHLSFQGVLSRMAADAGLAALWQREPPDAGSWQTGKFPSEWFVVARDRADFGRLNADSRWSVPQAPAGTPLWTDDFSNILSVIRR
jgi:spermidine synthase